MLQLLVMNKALFQCELCNNHFYIEFKEVADLPNSVCPKCGNDNIFITDYEFEEELDKEPLKLGTRGCGTPGRFK